MEPAGVVVGPPLEALAATCGAKLVNAFGPAWCATSSARLSPKPAPARNFPESWGLEKLSWTGASCLPWGQLAQGESVACLIWLNATGVSTGARTNATLTCCPSSLEKTSCGAESWSFAGFCTSMLSPT